VQKKDVQCAVGQVFIPMKFPWWKVSAAAGQAITPINVVSVHPEVNRWAAGKYYNGEPVRSVHVKTGILIKETIDRDRERWVDEQQFMLQAVGDHFFGKAVMQVNTCPYNQHVISPVVIYSLELANGQKRIAGPFGIALQNWGDAEEINSGCYYGDTRCAKTFDQALQELNASLAEISDASATVVKKQIHGRYAR
jgi:hypothetical protein